MSKNTKTNLIKLEQEVAGKKLVLWVTEQQAISIIAGLNGNSNVSGGLGTAPEIDLSKFEPQKDEDGFYIWNSWKARRRAYVAKVTGKKDQWIDEKDFAEAAKPFVEKYPYVKKADR